MKNNSWSKKKEKEIASIEGEFSVYHITWICYIITSYRVDLYKANRRRRRRRKNGKDNGKNTPFAALLRWRNNWKITRKENRKRERKKKLKKKTASKWTDIYLQPTSVYIAFFMSELHICAVPRCFCKMLTVWDLSSGEMKRKNEINWGEPFDREREKKNDHAIAWDMQTNND